MDQLDVVTQTLMATSKCGVDADGIWLFVQPLSKRLSKMRMWEEHPKAARERTLRTYMTRSRKLWSRYWKNVERLRIDDRDTLLEWEQKTTKIVADVRKRLRGTVEVEGTATGRRSGCSASARDAALKDAVTEPAVPDS